ncbi:transmembrane protein [Coprinopsis sp. MPI-PUGE-AT-0042]|nr:transmembrane protein [Coprinopsis sp. MPI-PUGE-AT-0042]
MASNTQQEGMAKEAGREALAQDEAKGANVYSFDPDAPPTEKASGALRAAQDKLAPMKHVEGAGGRLLQGLVNSAPTPLMIPSIVIEDSDEQKTAVPAPNYKAEPKAATGEEPPTDAPPKPSVHDFCTVGWTKMHEAKYPPLADEGEERDSAILNQFLSEQYYSAWWQNAGILVFAVVATRFFTWLRFGVGGVFIVLTMVYTHYKMGVQRFEREARDDILRELTRGQLGETNPESVEWINRFLSRFWRIYEPILSATITSSVDQVLSVNCPGFLDSLRLTEFSLGNKAPRLEKIWTMVQEEGDVVQWEWTISFSPHDTLDMTEREIQKKLNPKIILLIRLGKGLATASLPILVEDIALTGKIRIRMKMSDEMPYVQMVDFCFLEPPVIDYALKPLGGDTFGIDIASLPGLSPFIRDTTHSILGPMMYYPNMYHLDLAQLLSGQPLDAAIGVLEVMVHSARAIKGGSIADGSPDPYVSLAIDAKPEVAKTKFRPNTHNPTWMETKYILINKLEGALNLHVYDHNARRKNHRICTATFDLNVLKDEPVHEGTVTKLVEGSKECGELRYDVNYYPVASLGDPKAAAAAVSTSEESGVGIVRLIVHQAKELDTSRSTSGELNPAAKVHINNGSKPDFSTITYKRSRNPGWEAPYEYLCSSKDTDVVTIKLVNDRDFRRNPTIGYMSIKLKDLLECKAQGRDWFTLNNCKSGKIRVSATWKPVAMSGGMQSAAGKYVPPIGAVRLWIRKAENVMNVDKLGSKSDPYVRVQIRNETKGKTERVNNDLNPVWDEILYVPVHSLRESIMLDCLDYERMRSDRPLGSAELHVKDLADKTDDPEHPFKSTGSKEFASTLTLNKGDTTGVLHYQATFVPAWKMHIHFAKHAGGEPAVTDDEDGGYVSSASSASDASGSSIKVAADLPLTYKAPKRDSKDLQATMDTPVDKTPTATSHQHHHHSKDELLAQQSGIVVFNVVSGKLHDKGRIEVVLDDLEWPCVSTPKAKSRTAKWEFVGEGFVKEIDFSQVHLFLDAANEEGEDRVVAQWSGSVKEFLRDTLHGPKEYTLSDKNGRETSTILIEARYIPVPVTLEPRESVNNQGTLRVDLLDGQDMLAVDRGATRSDPYAVFSLNGEKVFKSETHKKTLTPEWNENFEVNIASRAHTEFKLEVFDWNRIEHDESLGSAIINIRDLEAFQLTERWIALSTEKHGQKGRVRVRLLFQPKIIAKSRKTQSTFSSAGGRAMTTIGGLPVNAGKGVVHGVTGIFKKDSD